MVNAIAHLLSYGCMYECHSSFLGALQTSQVSYEHSAQIHLPGFICNTSAFKPLFSRFSGETSLKIIYSPLLFVLCIFTKFFHHVPISITRSNQIWEV